MIVNRFIEDRQLIDGSSSIDLMEVRQFEFRIPF